MQLTSGKFNYAEVEARLHNYPTAILFFFHCSDTVSRSGMFCAIATTIDRCKTEGVVDILQVVKALRVQKPGAILNVVSTHRSVGLIL